MLPLKPTFARAGTALAALLMIALALQLGPVVRDAAAASCDARGAEAKAVADAREHVRQACPCDQPKSRTEYLRCARRLIDLRIADRRLPSACSGAVRTWAARSICGRDDAQICCVKSQRGPWRPLVRNADTSCRAPKGGDACSALYPHLDDACLRDAGCWQNRCGDGIIGPLSGEECEPPGSAGCNESCREIRCGNRKIDLGEECDPPGNGCTTLCTFDRCGNGAVDLGETCEPPNTPGCDAQCHRVQCGNGVVEPTWGEDCEPPGSASCDAQCHFVHTCGNGVIESGEECDGQTGCEADCRLARSLCCDFGDSCLGLVSGDLGSNYFFGKECVLTLGGDSVPGVCEGGDPCPPPIPPELDCRLAPCGDRAIDPVQLCCQQGAGGCRQTLATMASAVATFGCGNLPPFDDSPVDRLVLGTCGSDGRCVPAR